MTAGEMIRIMSERIFRAMKLDKSVYSEVKDDPSASTQSILMPFLIEVALIVIGGIAILPLWFIYGPWIPARWWRKPRRLNHRVNKGVGSKAAGYCLF